MKKIFLVLVTIYLLIFAAISNAEKCESQRVKLQILGSRGPELLDNKASTGYLLWLDNKARVIVDAGPGSLQRFKQSGARFEDVHLILFTHFHVDHSADFAGYIKGAFFTERDKDLEVWGPSGDTFILSTDQYVNRNFDAKHGLYPYLAPFIDPDGHSKFKIKAHTYPWTYKKLDVEQIYQDTDFIVKTVSVHHGPFPALGYRLEVAGCVVSFTGDMSGRLRAMPDLALDSDILVAHNAIAEDAVGVPQLLHMKPSYIGKMAKQASVKKLLLTHLMKRSLDRKDETMALIRQSYQGPVEFPNDLDVYHP